MPTNNLPQINILGVGINAITLPQAVEQIAGWIDTRTRQYVSVCNVHTIMECQHNEAMRQAVNRAGLTTPDGMPLVWLGRWLAQLEVNRVYGPDLMLALCELSGERGYTHYFCGGALGVPELLAERLQVKFPNLRVVGTYSPPFHPLSPAEESQLIERLNRARPDIIWVGLGTPKQDLWMARYRERLNAPVMIAVGAAFDFFSGRVPQAPRWMQRSGLEWFYRLSQEPQRLWYRYLIYNPWFVMLLMAQGLGLKHYPLPSGPLPSAQAVPQPHSVSDATGT